MSQWVFHGNGVASKLHRCRKRKNGDPEARRYYYARYQYQGRRYFQQAGTTERQALALLARICEDRAAAQRDKREWIPPAIQVKLDRLAERKAKREAEALERAAEALVWERVVQRFKALHLKGYSNRVNAESKLAMLGRYFTGRRMDKQTRGDVRAYIADRLAHTGVFEGTKGGVRAAQTDIAMLSRLYMFLIDEEEHPVTNPCTNAWRHRTKSDHYQPAHTAIVPTAEEWEALLDEAETLAEDRRGPVAERLSAFLQLVYCTASRPEEACRLRLGDVELPDRDKVRSTDGEPVLGAVTYRDTKTGEAARKVALHPDAEAALVAIMEPEPENAEDYAAWAARPVFARANGEPWTTSTYRRVWEKLRARVAKRHPRLAGMWVRDLRVSAITDTREAGTDPKVAARIAGHTERMSDRYTRPTSPAERKAILRLHRRVAVPVAVATRGNV